MFTVKVTPENILQILTHIFDLFLLQGKFAYAFKKGKVIPALKKEYKTDVNNRAISASPRF